MCLARITRNYKTPRKSEFWAWKCFSSDDGYELRFPVRGGEAPRGQWLQAKGRYDLKILSYRRPNKYWEDVVVGRYKPGFHVFRNKPRSAVYGNCIVRVKVRGLTTVGRQDLRDCLVVQEMYIPQP